MDPAARDRAAGAATRLPGARPGRLHAFRALRHRPFRAWMLALGLSFAGSWMERVALGWLVYRLTGSAVWLGAISLAGQLPVLLLSPLAGVAADRYPVRKVLLATQILLAVHGAVLALLVHLDLLGIAGLIGMALLLGVFMAFDMPARHTFVNELSGPEDLPSAIALNSAMVNVARIAGPAAAGFLVAAFGEAVCFAVNAFTFLAPTAVLLRVRPAFQRPPPTVREPPLRELRAGMAYARRAEHVRIVMPLVAISSLVAVPYLAMLPAFAKDVLAGGPQLLGWLNVAVGAGAIVGAVGVAAIVERRHLARRLALGFAAFSAGLVVVGLSNTTWLTLAALPVAGFGMATELSTVNTLLQTVTPGEFRGRVVSLYTMTFVGLFPIGSLIMGAVGEAIGIGPAVAAGGGLVAFLVPVLLRRVPRLEAVLAW